ncbi:MAG: DUF3179 domain-containing protein [Acidimicrobiia bacterium]|nr:DUF3179 domain-containing protein [Acidimicrobiia bacterium]
MVDFSVEARAYAISDLRNIGFVNDTVAGVPVAVVLDPGDHERWYVFGRIVDHAGQAVEVELVLDGETIKDVASGSTWDPLTGRAVDGPLEGADLPRLPALTSFPGGGPTKAPIFDAFWPNGTVWRPGRSG